MSVKDPLHTRKGVECEIDFDRARNGRVTLGRVTFSLPSLTDKFGEVVVLTLQ